jgi:hypothetical protein
MSLIANDERVFKILIFWTYLEIAKLIASQLKGVRTLSTDKFWKTVQPSFRSRFYLYLGHDKSHFTSLRSG